MSSSNIDEIKHRMAGIDPSVTGPAIDDIRALLAELARVTSERACHCGRPVSVAPRDLCGACIEFDTDIKCYVGRAAPEGKG